MGLSLRRLALACGAGLFAASFLAGAVFSFKSGGGLPGIEANGGREISALLGQGRYAEAESRLRAFIPVRPYEILPRLQLAQAVSEQGRWEEGDAVIAALAKDFPRQAGQFYNNIAVAHLMVGRGDAEHVRRARSEAEKARALGYPVDPSLR